jgi:hypothetical protein
MKYLLKKLRFNIPLILLLIALGLIITLTLNKNSLKTLSLFDSSQKTEPIDLIKCNKLVNHSDKQKCWEDALETTLKEQGIKEAFLVFENLYKTEPSFAASCHGNAHRLGEVTYQLLIDGQDFDFPPQTSFCGYGFYHGLTELLIQTKGPKEAGLLCDSKKSEITRVLYDACYHGIGHGALSSSAKDTQIWGDAEKMVNYALNLCDQSTADPIEKSRCASGIFMELGDDYANGQLKLADIQDDPLALCRKQQEFGKMDCYTQLNGVLSMLSGRKLKTAAKFVEAIPEDKYAVEAIITIAAPTLNINKTDFTEDINNCRSIQERLHLYCIKGLALAFLLNGAPGVEYEQAINFCQLSILTPDEKESCHELLLRHSSEMYPLETMKVICSKVDLQYQKNYCLNN